MGKPRRFRRTARHVFSSPVWFEDNDGRTTLLRNMDRVMTRLQWHDLRQRMDAFFAIYSDADIEEYQAEISEQLSEWRRERSESKLTHD